jgi:hypothetical protein
MSDFHGGATAPAGWYPAGDLQRERYWNGTAWTDAYRPRVGVPSPTAPPMAYNPPPGYQPYGYQPYGYVQAPNHGPAIASMVLGIVSFFISIFGVVTAIIGLTLGIMSLKECQPNGPKRGRGMAIAGIACSCTALGLWLLLAAFFGLAFGALS